MKSPEKLYPKDFVGPYKCNDVAVCFSYRDFKTEIFIKSRMIEAIKNLEIMVENSNNQYMEYLSKPCPWWDIACKNDRKRTKL